MRKRALNDFEKDFFKLMNNAIFGLAVLDISKTLMYDYHYNVMKRHYGEKISLMYTDTDSLVYFIETDDFYEDMVNNPILLDRMDTANLPENHPCYIAERKKIPGLFSDETNGDIMTEFCALRSKSYSYKIGIDSSKEEIRAKGVRGHVVKNHMTFEEHRRYEEDVNDIRQVSSPIIQNENEISIPSPDIEPSLPTTRQIVRRAPRTSRNNYTWVDDKPSINKINFNENSGLKVQPEGDQPIDFFNLLLTSDFYSLVVKETNNYAADLYMNRSSDKSRISNWVDVDIDELKIFFGLLFHTGTIKMSRIEDYWKTSKLFNLNIFRASMSRNRYMLIMRALHFCTNPESESDIQNISRIYKIEPVLNYFNNRMKEIYQPSKNLSLVLWRGRLLFRQYIKNKRHKYGVKLYMLTEPIGLVQKILIYTGQGTNVSSDMTHTECVVEQLMEDHLYKGHSLFMDNYYNSVNLAHKLLEKKT
ncbi:hypothetical protein QTP88_009263 [Uroleucon formosanum]